MANGKPSREARVNS